MSVLNDKCVLKLKGNLLRLNECRCNGKVNAHYLRNIDD